MELVVYGAILAMMAVAFVVQRKKLLSRIDELIDELENYEERSVRKPLSHDESINARYRLLAHAEKIAKLGSWEWDITTNRLTWSEELFRIYGIPPQDFENPSEAMLLNVIPEDKKRITELVFHAFNTLQPVGYDTRIRRPDGAIRVIRVKGDVIEEYGRPVRMYGSCHDVSELRDNEKSLARLNGIIAASDDAIISLTEYGMITGWNKGAEKIFGYSAAEILNESILKTIPPNYKHTPEQVLASIRNGNVIEHYETERIRKDGKIIYVSISTYPYRNEDGELINVTTFIRDITEKKTADDLIYRQTQELERANKRLRDLDRLKTEFVSNVSHELRTPIAAVKGAAANINYGFLGEVTKEQKDSLDIIARNVDRLGRLIENLLDLSRIEAGELKIELKPMDLRVPVKWAVNGILALARQKNLTIALDLPESPIAGRFDEDRVVQIVTNLVGNGLRFAKSEIRVTLFADEQSAFLVVEDDGVGIPEDELSLIFERFRQARTNRGQHGTGLGLSIVSGIIEAHGGRIWAENRKEPEHGARFTAVLPLAGPVTDENPAAQNF